MITLPPSKVHPPSHPPTLVTPSASVGLTDGDDVGACVGELEGDADGLSDGDALGAAVESLGEKDGDAVGDTVQSSAVVLPAPAVCVPVGQLRHPSLDVAPVEGLYFPGEQPSHAKFDDEAEHASHQVGQDT